MKNVVLMMGAILATQPLFAQLQLKALDGLAAKAKESVEITLDPAAMQLANGFLGGSGGDKSGDAKDAKKVLANLKSITVRTYEFDSAGKYDVNVVRTLSDQLTKQGWSRIVNIRDGEESFELYSKSEQGKNTGFAMIAAEPKELAVIHIEGSISLADLSGLGGQFGIPKLPLPEQKSDQKNKKGKE